MLADDRIAEPMRNRAQVVSSGRRTGTLARFDTVHPASPEKQVVILTQPAVFTEEGAGKSLKRNGGRDRTRTCDLLRVKNRHGLR